MLYRNAVPSCNSVHTLQPRGMGLRTSQLGQKSISSQMQLQAGMLNSTADCCITHGCTRRHMQADTYVQKARNGIDAGAAAGRLVCTKVNTGCAPSRTAQALRISVRPRLQREEVVVHRRGSAQLQPQPSVASLRHNKGVQWLDMLTEQFLDALNMLGRLDELFG